MSREKQTKNNQMTAEQGALVTADKFQKHIVKIAEFYAKRTRDFKFYKKEFISIANAAACEVAMRFDPSKGYQFTTFSTLYIKGMIGYYILKYVKSSFVDKHDRMFANLVSIDSLINEDDEDQTGEQIICANDIAEQEAREYVLNRIDNLLVSLSPDDRKLIEMKFCFDGDKDALSNWAEAHHVTKRALYLRIEDIMKQIALQSIK